VQKAEPHGCVTGGRSVFYRYSQVASASVTSRYAGISTGNRAIRRGKWKLVWGSNIRKWELFDMELDRTETNDLASRFPQRVAQIEADWLQWAKQTAAPLKGTAM
jgi:hypothetical protein